jgi:hypothetical protein
LKYLCRPDEDWGPAYERKQKRAGLEIHVEASEPLNQKEVEMERYDNSLIA